MVRPGRGCGRKAVILFATAGRWMRRIFRERNVFLFDTRVDFWFFVVAGVREGGENPPRTRRCK
jgi:hypothetical protein